MKGEDTYLSVETIGKLLGVTERAVRDACQAGKYVVRKVPSPGRTGWKYEIALSSLSDEHRQKYLGEQVAARIAAEPQNTTEVVCAQSPAVLPPAGALARASQGAGFSSSLDETQRLRDHARNLLIKFVEEYPGTVDKAIEYLNAGYADGTLDARLRVAMANANDRRAADGDIQLKRRIFYIWKGLREKRGTLAPRKTNVADMSVQPWHVAAMALKQRPQGLTLKKIAELLAREFDPPPSYDMIRRFFSEKASQGEQLEGRFTGMQLRAKKHYTRRTAHGMEPWQEMHADGWTTHFTAPHPVTGEYVTYEVWHAHDVATRYVPPFGIGLTEHFAVILKCVENAVRVGGMSISIQKFPGVSVEYFPVGRAV